MATSKKTSNKDNDFQKNYNNFEKKLKKIEQERDKKIESIVKKIEKREIDKLRQDIN